jgi:hypothetical protein
MIIIQGMGWLMTIGMSVALKMKCCPAGYVLPNACSCDMLLRRWETMKRLIGAALVLTLTLPVAPVLAGDTFHALSRLPATAQANLTPMDEAQLAAIEGAQVSQSNAATVRITQSNAFTGTGSGAGPITQSNVATVTITQSNAADVR